MMVESLAWSASDSTEGFAAALRAAVAIMADIMNLRMTVIVGKC